MTVFRKQMAGAAMIGWWLAAAVSGAAAGGEQQHATGEQQDQRAAQPQRPGLGLEGRVQQHVVAVARDHVVEDLGVVVARGQALAHGAAHVARDLGGGIVDRLVLADDAAQLAANVAGAALEHGIGEDLGGFDGMRGSGGEDGQAEQQERRYGEPAKRALHFAPLSSGRMDSVTSRSLMARR